MGQEPEERSIAGEAVIVSGMALVVGSGLFEWLVVSPDHPAYALLRVIGAVLAATIVTSLLPRQ